MAVALIVGGLLQKRVPDLLDRIAEQMTRAIISAARP